MAVMWPSATSMVPARCVRLGDRQPVPQVDGAGGEHQVGGNSGSTRDRTCISKAYTALNPSGDNSFSCLGTWCVLLRRVGRRPDDESGPRPVTAPIEVRAATLAAMPDRALPDPVKLLAQWMEWERGETSPGRVLANLKMGGLRDVLEQLATAKEQDS